MTTSQAIHAAHGEREFVISRVVNAPRELVFRMWTEPKRVSEWWAPDGFTTPVCEMDVRPGGTINLVMCGPDGREHAVSGSFRAVVAAERLVAVVRAVPGRDGAPQLEALTTVTFARTNRRTRLTLHAALIKALPTTLAGMDDGLTQSLQRLEALAAARG